MSEFKEPKTIKVPEFKVLPDLPQIIRTLMNLCGASLWDIAEVCGVSDMTIQRIRANNPQNPSYILADKLIQLALENFTVEQLKQCRVIQ